MSDQWSLLMIDDNLLFFDDDVILERVTFSPLLFTACNYRN